MKVLKKPADVVAFDQSIMDLHNKWFSDVDLSDYDVNSDTYFDEVGGGDILVCESAEDIPVMLKGLYSNILDESVMTNWLGDLNANIPPDVDLSIDSTGQLEDKYHYYFMATSDAGGEVYFVPNALMNASLHKIAEVGMAWLKPDGEA